MQNVQIVSFPSEVGYKMCHQRFSEAHIPKIIGFLVIFCLHYFYDKTLYVDHWFMDPVSSLWLWGPYVGVFFTYFKYFWRKLIFSVELQEIIAYCLKPNTLYMYIFMLKWLIFFNNLLSETFVIFFKLLHLKN